MLFRYKQPSASKRRNNLAKRCYSCKSCFSCFLKIYPNGIEDIEWTNLVVKRCKCCIGCLLRLSSRCHWKQSEKTSFVKPLNKKKNHGWKEKTGMALRHSDRHLDPHGHSHGPRRDELHGWRIARACTICPRAFTFSTARSLWWSRSVSALII